MFIRTSVLLVLFLTGCSSLFGSKNQSLSVVAKCEGEVVVGAICKLTSSEGVWYATSPGSVFINKSTQDITVECQKENIKGTNTFKSGVTSGMAGNAGLLIIPVIGLIAIGTDTLTGASFEYPPELNVEMQECKAPALKPVS
jgi:hypothetical protein